MEINNDTIVSVTYSIGNANFIVTLVDGISYIVPADPDNRDYLVVYNWWLNNPLTLTENDRDNPKLSQNPLELIKQL